MELILIDENKLKIMMDDRDMNEFGLDENEFHLSACDIRAVLSKIFQKTNIHTGFEHLSEDDQILIQLYPEAHGGCELFVTKITLGEEFFNKEENFMPPNDEKFLLPQAIKISPEQRRTPLSYSFAKIEHVIFACKELNKLNFSGESSLYHQNDGKYLLVINNTSENSKTKHLAEFGELENTENSILITLERGQCILKENAVDLLSEI